MNSETLISRLAKFDSKELLRVLGPEWLTALKSAGVADEFDVRIADSVRLAGVIWSVFGEALLSNQYARQLFLDDLPDPEFSDLVKSLLKRSSGSRGDDLLRLSNLKWSRSSPIAEVFVNDLGFSADFLPEEPFKKPAREMAAPNVKLHPLHDYQVELVERVSAEYLEKSENFLMQLPTGSGKTRVMMEAVVQFHAKHDRFPFGKGVIWLAHSRELLEQAIETFRNVWAVHGKRPIAVNRFYGSFDPGLTDFDDSFVFASLQKLGRWSSDHPKRIDKLSQSIGSVIVDEAHKIVAPTYLKAAKMMSEGGRKILIGVTATPGRGSESETENHILASIFDGNLVTAALGENPVATLQAKGVLARLERVKLETGVDVSGFVAKGGEDYSQDYSESALRNIGANTRRNRVIVEGIIGEVERGHSTLVFACSVEHARNICAALAINGVRAAYLDSSTPDHLRSEVIRSYRSGETKVLVNFEILTTGFDAPITKSVLIARPTKSLILYSQIIGRGLRGPRVGGQEVCRLIDVVDNVGTHGDLETVYSFFEDYWQ